MITVLEQPIMTALVDLIKTIRVLETNKPLDDTVDRRILTEGIVGIHDDATEYFIRYHPDVRRYDLRRRPAMTNEDGILIGALFSGQCTLGAMSKVVTTLIEDHENSIRRRGVSV